MPGKYRIEMREAGVWFDIDGADSFGLACRIASYYVYNAGNRPFDESRYRIVGPTGQINKDEGGKTDAEKEQYWNSLIHLGIFGK